MRQEFDILENAISSLREALKKYENGANDDLEAYKFAILHFAHFLELLFKHYVILSHPLLVYKNPFSKRIEKENTIGLWEAVQFLRNEGKPISDDFNKDLEWLKGLRNDIEHYKFTFDIPQVRNVMGRLIRATDEFNSEHDLVDIPSALGEPHVSIYSELGDEYKNKLAIARQTAADTSTDGTGHVCSWCGENGVCTLNGNKLYCRMCEHEEEVHVCCHCGGQYREGEVRVWNDDHPPHVDYMCDYCYERIMDMD